MKRITRATLKSFIARELKNNNLYIKVKSSFDGMTDCVQEVKDGFSKATSTDMSPANTLGICGIWLTNQSRDSYSPYEDENYIGYEVYNCCGSFLVAAKKV